MEIQFQVTDGVDIREIEKTLSFYIGRLETGVDRLNIRLREYPGPGKDRRYQVNLDCRLADGQRVALEEVQADPRLATQRLLDRLERRVLRRQTIWQMRA